MSLFTVSLHTQSEGSNQNQGFQSITLTPEDPLAPLLENTLALASFQENTLTPEALTGPSQGRNVQADNLAGPPRGGI